MESVASDAFVLFGATGDLAYKKIFPALQALARDGDLDMPVVGIARGGGSVETLRARARDSIEHNGGAYPARHHVAHGVPLSAGVVPRTGYTCRIARSAGRQSVS